MSDIQLDKIVKGHFFPGTCPSRSQRPRYGEPLEPPSC